MSSEIAIKVDGVSKRYQVYDRPNDRLKQFLFPWAQRIFGLKPKKYYKEFWALKNISFEVSKGTSLGILGLNGAGKSTLLQIICNTLMPTSGKIHRNGRVAALLELGAGFNPEFTGLENVYLNGSILGFSRRQIDDRLPLILDFADIGDFISQPVKTYSSGMYVRLAFAIAIHSDPDILVIDEALAVGDFIFQQKCNLFFKEKLPGVTKIFVSHDIGSIANMTDTALILRQGELMFYGNSQAAIQVYQIASRSAGIDRYLLKSNIDIDLRNEFDSSANTDSKWLNESKGWLSVPYSSLSGSLESSIISFTWQVNGENNHNILSVDDLLDFSILIDSRSEIRFPVIGYQVQDRFGCVVFGQNTTDSKIKTSTIPIGKSMIHFRLSWPEISDGKYSVTLGIGTGVHGEAHNIVCWAHNIVTFDSIARRPVHGIFNNEILNLRVTFYEK